MIMRRAILILLSMLVLGTGVFTLAYVMAGRLYMDHLRRAGDDLDWLQREFSLSGADLERVRRLHEGYLPQCGEMCRRIAEKKRELEHVLDGSTNFSAEAELKLKEVAALRAQCQAQMLRHFYEVSRTMSPEQGRRYLAEMKRLTLGFHEQVEASMANGTHSAHGHH